jgi:hypothetical protein
MRSRNVIISLFLVLALFVFIFMKIRSEPRKKIVFNRNLSKVEYSQFALCLMNCQFLSANDIDYVLKNGDVVAKTVDRSKHPCPSYILKGKTKTGLSIMVFAIQCGRVAKISKCYLSDNNINCECRDEIAIPISIKKINADEFFA